MLHKSRGQDWIRVLFILCCTSYLVYRILMSTNKLLEKKMGSTEMTLAAQDMLLPSVTICRESYLKRYRESQSKEWIKYANITEDYQRLLKLDKMLRGLTQILTINNKFVKAFLRQVIVFSTLCPYPCRSEYIFVNNDTLAHSSFARVPAHLWPPSPTALKYFAQKNVSNLIQASVGPKAKSVAFIGGIQPCLTYNPIGSYHPGLSPGNNVSTFDFYLHLKFWQHFS